MVPTTDFERYKATREQVCRAIRCKDDTGAQGDTGAFPRGITRLYKYEKGYCMENECERTYMLYVVIEPEDFDFSVGVRPQIIATDAENEEDALWTYAMTIGIKGGYLEHAHDRVINTGFAKYFYLHTRKEQNAWNYRQEILVSEKEVSHRIRAFFGEHEDWASIYIALLNDNERDIEKLINRYSFTDEMLAYMYLGGPNWTNLRTIPLQDIERPSIKSIRR